METSPPDQSALVPPVALRGSCRLCAVRCERIVYPAACVAAECPRLYAYEEDGVTWIGCVEKIFTPELDAGRLREIESAAPGFGALRAERTPLPICAAAIDPTFPHRAEGPCRNPGFAESAPTAAEGRPPFRIRR